MSYIVSNLSLQQRLVHTAMEMYYTAIQKNMVAKFMHTQFHFQMLVA